MIRNKFVLAHIVLVSLLSACTAMQDTGVYNKPDPTAETISIDEQISRLLQLAEQQAEPEASVSTMRAVKLLLDNSQTVRAKTVFARTKPNALTASAATEYQILLATFAKQDGDANAVRAALGEISAVNDAAVVTRDQQVDIGFLNAWAHLQNGQALESAKQRIAIDSLLQNELDVTENREAIWLTLNALDDNQQQAAFADTGVDLQGWMTLVSIYQSNQGDVFELRRQLSRWQSNWPAHPAAETLPTELASAMARKRARWLG